MAFAIISARYKFKRPHSDVQITKSRRLPDNKVIKKQHREVVKINNEVLNAD